ncbi:hypothetical protein JTB14_001953 [Gonioctena quinquepunctata]|nr:hypothetical protein JTB14_001953 [Gonioctena quinquepunctata]
MMVVACFVPAQSYRTSDSNITKKPVEIKDVLPSFPIGEWITKAIKYLSEFFDLKVRSIKFIASLYTTENLTLLKTYLNIFLRFCAWLRDIIPSSISTNSFFSNLFPEMKPKGDLPQVPLPGTKSDDSSLSFYRSDDSDTVDEEENNVTEEYGKQVMELPSFINARSSF